jgi:hypothetical protein
MEIAKADALLLEYKASFFAVQGANTPDGVAAAKGACNKALDRLVWYLNYMLTCRIIHSRSELCKHLPLPVADRMKFHQNPMSHSTSYYTDVAGTIDVVAGSPSVESASRLLAFIEAVRKLLANNTETALDAVVKHPVIREDMDSINSPAMFICLSECMEFIANRL